MKLIAAGILVICLFAGCSGFTPYQPRDHREEGPPQGLFTGPTGEYSIEPGKPHLRNCKQSTKGEDYYQ
ncbi:MAG: hypothetical protein WC405_12135 [Syntrophales bacterium]